MSGGVYPGSGTVNTATDTNGIYPGPSSNPVNITSGNTGLYPGDEINVQQGTGIILDGETYTLVEIDNQIYLRRGSDGTLVEPGVPAGSAAGAAFQIGFLPPDHDDHSGGENDGEIILGDEDGNIISALPIDVRANGTIIDGDNGLIGIDNGRVVLNVSTLVQASDNRPVTSDAVQTALNNLPAGHSDIGGILSISSTVDKVAEIGIYDTDSARIGQQFVISTVNSVNDIQDITINSEPASGTSTTQLAQRLEITLNKATAITDGELRVPTTQAVLDYVTSIETDPVTTANVRAVLQDDTGVGGISWSIDSGSNKIIGVANIASKADTSTTVIDTDIGLNDDNQVTSINVGGTVRQIAGGGDATNAVLYTPQTLTEAQKEQVRDNIDAAGHLAIDGDLCLELANGVTAPSGFVQDTTTIPGSDAMYNLLVVGIIPGANTGDYVVYIQDGQTEYSVFELVGILPLSGGSVASLFLWVTSGAGTRPDGLFTLSGDLYRPADNFSSTSIFGSFDGNLDTVVAKQLQLNSFDFRLVEQSDGVVSIGASPTLEADDVPAIVLDSEFVDATDITPTAATFSTTGNLGFTEATPPSVHEVFKITFTYGSSGTVTFVFSGSDVEFSDLEGTAWLIHSESLNVTAGTRPTVGDEAIELTHSGTSQKITFNNGPVVLQGSVNRVTGTDNVFNLTGGGDATNAVLYTEQTLTTPQQTQARTNIGAQVAGNYLTAIPDDVIRDGDFTVTGGEVVSVNIDGTAVPFPSGGDTPATAVLYTEQTLTNAQQTQARTNIAAAHQTELWATGQDYVVGDNVLVVFSGDIIGFACLQAHTSDNTPGGTGNGQPRINVDNSNWQQIGFQNIIPWVAGFAWQTGDVVLYRDLTPNNLSNSGLYIRRVGGVDTDSSQNPFVNTADWLPLGGSGAGGIEVLSSDPSSPTDGQVWYNSSQEIIKYFDGELTLDIAKFLGYFSTDPTHSSANHSDGDMWYNTTENEFKYFSGSGVVHTIITNLDSITALSDGQAVLDSIAAEVTTRAEDDAIEATARIAGDEAERDFVETTLHVDAADSQSYYQFSGVPAIFAEDPAIDYGITIAMPETITDEEELVQAENIGETTKVFKLTLRYGDGANDTKQYVVTTGGYNFTISDERTSETFRLPTIEGTYSAASVHINGTSTRRQDCFLAIGGWYGRIAQVDMAHVLNVSNGDILAGRSLEVGQDYSEHTIADNNNTAVVGLVFDNQTTGSHTGINAYVLQRRNRIVRYRAATSNGLFSFRNGNSVVDRFHPSRVPDVVSQQTVEESNWLGLKLVTIQNAIPNTSASGQSNRLAFAVGDKMLVAVGEAVDSASAGISIPGIAISKNPSTFTGGSVNLGLFYPGGNDPSEEYSDYSSATEANFNAHIFDMEYSNASGAWTFFFGGQTVGETAIATSAAGFHGTSIWNMATISAATKAGAGGIIRSVALGGNIAGLASDTNFWVTTELGALWVSKTPWLATGYGSNALVQAHTNPNDPTSDVKRDFTFRGFQYFDQHGSIGAGDDGHIYRLVINPEVTFTVTFGNVTHTATYRFNDDTAAMHTFFGNPASYSPTLAGTGVSLTTAAPGGEPNDQLYLDYAVNGQNTPVVSYQWVGVLSTTDDDFETYSPFRRIDLANTVVDIHYPDGGATYHIPLSSNINDYTVGGEANGAIDQIVTSVNTHTAQGHSAVRVDAGFADTITNTRPVLRLDQTGTHALQNAPTITIAHPSGQNTGDLAVERFADGGYDTIGRPGGLFDPNNYDTRAENDAKLAAIASTHGYAENIVPNAGTSGVTYPLMSRLGVGTEIFRSVLNASEVAAFFANSSASRSLSLSESNGVITPTITADTSKQDVIDASNRLPTVNIGTGAINNSELNTLNGINTNETIQEQLNGKAGTVPEIYQNVPTGTTGNGLFLTTNNNAGTQLRFTALPDTGTGGSALKGILTSEFVATSITGGGNATWTESAGLQFTSTTTPVANTRYILRFDVSGPVLFEFNANDVQFANSQWQIHRADVVIVSGNVDFGDNLAYNPAGTMFANIYSGDISLGSNITLVDGVLDSTGGGVTDAFRYSQLLTGGFLVQRTTAMDTSARRAYTDTQGAYGTANTTYYYEATSKSWFDVASGGTALISFPST